MIPLRLLIFGILAYAGWKLLQRGKKDKGTPSSPTSPSGSDPQDVLVEDPVCHVLIPQHQAVRLRKNGITYYFCSERCCDQFERQTEQGEK